MFLALFTGRRLKLAFHPQARFILWKCSLNIGRLSHLFPASPSLCRWPDAKFGRCVCCPESRIVVEKCFWGAGERGPAGRRWQLCSLCLNSTTKRHGSECARQSYMKVLFSDTHRLRWLLSLACQAAIFLSSAKSSPVLFWQTQI